jgi:hypothetical protein
VLHRVLEPKEEIRIFLSDSSNDDANLFSNEDFVQKVAYFLDIFEKLDNFNKSIWGPQINTLN